MQTKDKHKHIQQHYLCITLSKYILTLLPDIHCTVGYTVFISEFHGS